MVTFQQYLSRHRITKTFRTKTPHFHGCPFKYGICIRVGTVKPKKPNSAQRKITKVRLSNQRELIAYIPGFGHNLEKNKQVIIRGGRVPDLPGVRYHVVRGKADFTKVEEPKGQIRAHRLSKFGIKRIRTNPKPKRRSLNKSIKKKLQEEKKKIDPEILLKRKSLLTTNFF